MVCVLFLLGLVFWVPDVEGTPYGQNNQYIFGQKIVENFQVPIAERKVSLDFENARLKEVLNEFTLQTGIRFSIQSELADKNRITYTGRNKNVLEVLAEILYGSDLQIEVSDNEQVVIIKEKKEVQELEIQETVKGRVIDAETGEALPGVNIVIQGTRAGTTTNIDGIFELEVPDLEQTLVFTYIGYEQKEVSLDGRTEIEVVLKQEILAGEELVVVGYGTQQKRDLTGAISSINTEDLALTNVTSIDQALSGRAAGLQVIRNDAQPGGDVSFLIRGAPSTGAGNEPLIVIDGFPVSSGTVDPNTGSRYNTGTRSPLNSINPSDIESIEILKDVSATAIYGARAANGVVLITTKSGQIGAPEISYNFKQSFQDFKKPDVLNGSEFMRESNRFLKERWMANHEIGVYGGTDPSSAPAFEPLYTEEEIAQMGSGTDWMDEVTQTGRIQEHNISVNGGTENTQYLVSLNAFDQRGIAKNNTFNRLSGRLNLDQRLSDYIRIGVQASGSKVEFDNPSLTSAGSTWNGIQNSGLFAAARNFNPMLPVDGEMSTYPNPVSLLDITNVTEQNRLFVQSYAELELTENLLVRSQYGFDDRTGEMNFYLPTSTLYGQSTRGLANIGVAEKFDTIFNTTMSYKEDVFDGHFISALIGYEFQKISENGHDLQSTFFPTDAFLYNSVETGEAEPEVSSYRSVDRYSSYFGRANYTIHDKYLFTFTMRADGSSKFGEGNKFGYFPSGAFSWRISNENFMENTDWVSDLKLRVAVGQTGNSDISGAFEYYGLGANYYFGSQKNTGSYLDSYANPNLKWETTTEYNLGLDFSFFSDRIDGSIDVYNKEVSGLLGYRQLRNYLPQDQLIDNLGITTSKGFEVVLNTANVQTGNFVWETSVNLSAYRDRWKKRSPDVVLSSYESETDPLNAIWGYETDGLIQPGEEVPHMPGALPGHLKVRDINGYDENNNLTGAPDGIVNDADVVQIGTSNPDFMFGFTNNFGYKEFDLSVHLYGMIGLYRSNPYLTNAGDNFAVLVNGRNLPNILDQFWSSDNQDAKYPNNLARSSYYGASQYAREKADFLRVGNITLGYNFTPTQDGMLSSAINNARVYMDISNPFTITNYTVLDPEFSEGQMQYPVTKTLTFGVDITF